MSVTIRIAGSCDHEMNLANRNFCTLFASLALPYDPEDLCGTIDPVTVLEALKAGDPALAVRKETTEAGKATIIDCGIPLAQAQGYHQRLFTLAREAVKRGQQLSYC